MSEAFPNPHENPIPFVDETGIEFFWDFCCNCGREENAKLCPQKTTLIRTSLARNLSWEVTFWLPLCPACEKSARRKPLESGGWFAIAGLSFAIFWLLALVAAAMTDSEWLAKHTVLCAGFSSLVLLGVIVFARLPRKPQTAYTQPVRITSIRQDRKTKRIKKIRIHFTNPAYADGFVRLNDAAVRSKRVEVTTKHQKKPMAPI